MTASPLPETGPIVAWYGDDFTGASAVLEALSFGGVESVLFLDIPTPEQLARFRACGGIGIAGVARAKPPAWMDRELPRIYRALQALGAPITQYKVCSTFDSSPDTGSIGRALDIGADILGGEWFPLLVAAPISHRFQAFGNLFASVGGIPYRLDRHPVMSRHPVTPMDEADLRLHLGRQTARPVGLIDLVTLKHRQANAKLEALLSQGIKIVSIDVIDDDSQREAGRLVWEHRGDGLFAIASQGLEYALLAYWQQAGLLRVPQTPAIRPVARMMAVSGSCSPVTANQIAWAQAHGFELLRVDAVLATDPDSWRAHIAQIVQQALSMIALGKDPIAYTALGPDDLAIGALRTAVQSAGENFEVVNERIGTGLGRLLADVMRIGRLDRGIIAGGDTSSHATLALGAYALTALAPTVAGAALFMAHSEHDAGRPIEIALKGGQMGSENYFGRIKIGE